VLASTAAHGFHVLAIDGDDSLELFDSGEFFAFVVMERRRNAFRNARHFATHLAFELVDSCFSAIKAAHRIRATAVARTINPHVLILLL
jgi:hypothetical protein